MKDWTLSISSENSDHILVMVNDAGTALDVKLADVVGDSDGEVKINESVIETTGHEFIDFFQNGPISLHWLSKTGHIIWANQTELDSLGYTAEEYIGHHIMEVRINNIYLSFVSRQLCCIIAFNNLVLP